MLDLLFEYWVFLLIGLALIVAGVSWTRARRGRHVALSDDGNNVRSTLARNGSGSTDAKSEVEYPFLVLPPAFGTPDNLLKIKGLGPKIAVLLNGLGVKRFDQIAAWTEEQQVAIDRHLGSFKGRIVQDRWLDQAKLLAAGKYEEYEAEFGKIESYENG